MFGDRTRDELIDSILHTRTREHRAMPGFRQASSWEERRDLNIDCDKVYPGVLLANGDTIKNVDYLKRVGVTHVLNTAERHVQVRRTRSCHLVFFGVGKVVRAIMGSLKISSP